MTKEHVIVPYAYQLEFGTIWRFFRMPELINTETKLLNL